MEQNEFEIEAKRMRPALLRMATRYLEDSDDAEDVVAQFENLGELVKMAIFDA